MTRTGLLRRLKMALVAEIKRDAGLGEGDGWAGLRVREATRIAEIKAIDGIGEMLREINQHFDDDIPTIEVFILQAVGVVKDLNVKEVLCGGN